MEQQNLINKGHMIILRWRKQQTGYIFLVSAQMEDRVWHVRNTSPSTFIQENLQHWNYFLENQKPEFFLSLFEIQFYRNYFWYKQIDNKTYLLTFTIQWIPFKYTNIYKKYKKPRKKRQYQEYL